MREAAGDRFDALELNVYPSGWADRRHRRRPRRGGRVIDHLRARTGIELTVDEVLESPHLFIGSIDALVDKFQGSASGSGSARSCSARSTSWRRSSSASPGPDREPAEPAQPKKRGRCGRFASSSASSSGSATSAADERVGHQRPERGPPVAADRAAATASSS